MLPCVIIWPRCWLAAQVEKNFSGVKCALSCDKAVRYAISTYQMAEQGTRGPQAAFSTGRYYTERLKAVAHFAIAQAAMVVIVA